MRYLMSIVMVAALCSNLPALPGRVILTNGRSLDGDVNRSPDGGCRLIMKHGSLRLEKEEIKKIIIFSSDDHVAERFNNSFRNTPAHSMSLNTAPTPYDYLIHKEARRNNLDPALVKAVIKAESNFNPYDISCKGARGLMQLMPGTARLLGVKSIFSPEENIRGGTRFLRDMMDQFDGDWEKALAAYNAGPGAVKKYRSVPPYRETRSYVDIVQRYYNRYRLRGGMCTHEDSSGCMTIYNVR